MQSRARLAIDRFNERDRRAAPRSNTGDPHMGDDWGTQRLEVGNFGGGSWLRARVGSSIMQDRSESVDGPVPFNIPAGVHTGTAAHRVWLWNMRTNTVRHKLARLVLGSTADTADIPTLRQALRRAGGPAKGGRPPWINVQVQPHHWAFDTVHSLAEDLLGAAYETIGVQVWRV
jgi:hypothetical protein